MQWTVSELPHGVFVTFVAAGVALAIVGIAQLSKRPNLDAFPTVGPSGWLGSWWTAIRFTINADVVTKEGYRKHKGVPFKIPTLVRWVVMLSTHTHIEELRQARDDEILFLEPTFEDMNSEYTLGSEVIRSTHPTTVIRSQLTRNLGDMYPELRDEIVTTFEETLNLNANEWKSFPALSVSQQVVCKASNRAFVGLPLCRDPDFVTLSLQFTFNVIAGGVIIGFFPKFLKPLAARFITNVPRSIRRGLGHLRPIIEERQKYLKEYGNEWTDKPSDLLSWLMDEAGPNASVETLTSFVLSVNFASIHTTSEIFTFALYNLAAYPQYVQPLRDEVEGVIEQDGWSKASLSKMRKLDSFLRESTRMDSLTIWGMTRKSNKDFTFSDGTMIPKGTRINACLRAIQYDEEVYDHPEIFDGFRFVDKDETDEVERAKHHFVTTSAEYLPFGHGRHACPGRHFAAVELKSMLAHVLVEYDVKLEENTTCPRDLLAGPYIVAHPKARVMFRRRTGQKGGC